MWKKFSQRARRAIMVAQEECEALKQGAVGTEHLLLGLFVQSDCSAARVLRDLGVEETAYRETIARDSVKEESAYRQGEARLSPKAKRVLELSADEARRMRHNYIGTEHLLLALLREKDGLAAKVLRKMGLTLDKTRSAVLLYSGSGPFPQSQSEAEHTDLELHVTDEVQELLSQATEAAHKEGATSLEIKHLAKTLLQDESSWLVNVLQQCGLDRTQALAKLEQHARE